MDGTSLATPNSSIARRTLTGVVMISPAGATGRAPAGTGTVIEAESSPYGTVLEVGSGQFAGYTVYQFDRNTASACSTKTATVFGMTLSCGGAETDKTADWPIVTTVGKPIAGAG